MKHPTPSDFIVEAKEAHVSVIFKPSDSHYNFGRLADPEDIAQYGPLSRSSNVRHGKTGDTAYWRRRGPKQISMPLTPGPSSVPHRFPSKVGRKHIRAPAGPRRSSRNAAAGAKERHTPSAVLTGCFRCHAALGDFSAVGGFFACAS